jgi:hypothetical protein
MMPVDTQDKKARLPIIPDTSEEKILESCSIRYQQRRAMMNEELLGLLAKTEFTRREFVMTALAAGFALAVRPVSAQTISTDAAGRKPAK